MPQCSNAAGADLDSEHRRQNRGTARAASRSGFVTIASDGVGPHNARRSVAAVGGHRRERNDGATLHALGEARSR
jgi:hypothetical protein